MKPYSFMIDAYSHITPQKYLDALTKASPMLTADKVTTTPPLFDLDYRFRIMDKYEGLVQVLTLGWPAVEEVADAKKSVDLAKLANDEMAKLVEKYPERFVGAIACLPINNIEASLKEADRAIQDLRCRGVYVHSHVNGKPLDSPEFMPLYEKMSQYDLPIYIHPHRNEGFSDYTTEEESLYNICRIFGWPYDTTAAMTRLVFSGIMEKYPNLKVVTHHGGGMVPYYQERIIQHYSIHELKYHKEYFKGLTKAPIDYFRKFYADTAIHGNSTALKCAHECFGPDHIIFGCDMPLGDRQFGIRSYRQTINAIQAMDISDEDKKKIFEDNARELLHLGI
ncbi:amidohydrolase family protein [Chloroflexota bacterium]